MTAARAVLPITFCLSVAAALAVTVVVSWRGGGARDGALTASSSHAITIDEIRTLSTLLTRRVELADVCVTRIDGYLGSVEAALLVRGGHVDLGVDLDAGDLHIVDSSNHVATLRLPTPHVVTTSLDHSRTRFVMLGYSGVWRINPQPAPARGVVEQALASAQEQFAEAGREPAQIEAARRHVETVVTAWARTLGWNVRVEWR
jgi:hypothetical protein